MIGLQTVGTDLFLALLDADRFEGKPRDASHTSDASDLMRRLVKEKLLKFDGTRLFPERRAYTAVYPLSDSETLLYKRVTEYVQHEMNRAERLKAAGEGSRGAIVGFALTTLQRHLPLSSHGPGPDGRRAPAAHRGQRGREDARDRRYEAIS